MTPEQIAALFSVELNLSPEARALVAHVSTLGEAEVSRDNLRRLLRANDRKLDRFIAEARDSGWLSVEVPPAGSGRCSQAEWRRLRSAVFFRDDFHCTYCGSDGPLHCDHVVPVSRGGKDEMGNLTTACAGCNLSKSDLLLTEWRG